MPTLLGCWSIDKFAPDQEKIKGLRQSLVWESAIIDEISGDNFQGVLVHNTSQDFNLSDHFYADHKNELSIFITGNIYNLKDLSENYNLFPKALNTPEVILSLYCQHGIKFFNSLNGDFSIVIIDKKTNSIIIARDHIGIHPCAFYYFNQHLYFSTDSLALAKVFQDRDPINCQYLLNQLDVAHEWDYRSLPNKKVQRLLPGHLLKIEKDKLTIQKFWEPEKLKINKKLTWDKILNDFRVLLRDAVKIRSIAQYNCAAHLSGGLDSGIVAALARREYEDQNIFHGYSWSPPDNGIKNDLQQEANRVKKQSDILNIVPKFQGLTVEEFITYISNWRYELYIFHELKVLELAKKNRENLIFSGWGGDEFISINNDGIDSDLIFGLHWRSFLNRYPLSHPKRFMSALFYNVFLPLFYHHPHRYGPELDFFSRYIHENKCHPFMNRINLAKWGSRREIHLKLLYNYHIPARTESFFNMGIMYGIEYRFPLLDKRIVEYMMTIPSKFLIKGKYVRRILRELSDEFFPKELIWIDQKNEPALYETDKELRKSAAEEIIKEIPEFKKLPEFDIFNFEQLEKDIKLYKQNEFSADLDLLFLFLVVLKKRFEFIKEYTALNTKLE